MRLSNKTAIVTGAAHVVLGDEAVLPERAAALGPCRVLPQEYSHVRSRFIDVGDLPPEGRRVEELDPTCLDRIARFKRPRDYRFIDALPTNNYGKVVKRELQERLRVEADER